MSMKPIMRPREKSGVARRRSVPWRKSISEKRMSAPSPLMKKPARFMASRSTRSSLSWITRRAESLNWYDVTSSNVFVLRSRDADRYSAAFVACTCSTQPYKICFSSGSTPLISGSMADLPGSISASLELASGAQPRVAENRAEARAHGVPDDVVHVGDARGEKVLPSLDHRGEGESEKNGEDVRLHRRPIDAVKRDEREEAPRQKEDDVADDRKNDDGEDLRRDRTMREPMREMANVFERNRIDLAVALAGDG